MASTMYGYARVSSREQNLDNDFMQNRFQTMTMNVADATRIGR